MSLIRFVFLIAKFVLGITYTVSGFLKTVDISNTQLKVEEYLNLFGLNLFDLFSIPLTVLLVSIESFIGLSILFDLNKRFISKIAFYLTIFMFLITTYIYFFDSIDDCGCFGSLFVLNNDYTFYKNIVLTIAAFIYKKTYSSSSILVYSHKSKIIGTIYFIVYIGLFVYYNYKYIPFLDLSKYYIGYSFEDKNNTQSLDYIFKKDNGVEHVFSDDIAPWNDSTWSFVKVVEQSSDYFNDICFNKLLLKTDSLEIKDVTRELLQGVTMLIAVDSLSDINIIKDYRYYGFLQQMKKISNHIGYVTSETSDRILYYYNSFPYDFDVYQIDNTVLKNILSRKNIQFILLVNGVIVKKWYSNNVPTYINRIDSFVEEPFYYYFKRLSFIFVLTFILPFCLLKLSKHKLIVIFLLFVSFSCKNENLRLINNSTMLSDENKGEIRKVLDYYKNDSLKLEAAKFLINNMIYHYSYKDTLLLNSFYYDVDSILLNNDFNNIENGILTLEEKYNFYGLSTISDIQIINSNYLISNIEQAFKVWQNSDWCTHINFNQFCEYILPYKIEDLQILDDWRFYLSQSFSQELNLLQYCDTYKNSALRASILVNNNIKARVHPSIVYYNHNSIHKLSVLSNMPYGICNDYSKYVASVFRSIGLPATYDFTPQWPFRALGHTWNVVLANSGKFVPFNGAGANPGSPINFDEKMCKVYRRTFSANNGILDLIRTEKIVPKLFQSPCFIDVTNEYMVCSDIELNVCTPNIDYGYIAVFNDMQWIPVDFSKVVNGKLNFFNMGRNIIYLPLYYSNLGVEKYLSNPILLRYDGKCEILTPDTINKQNIFIKRKYPVFQDVYQVALRLIGGEFQASNNKDFKDAVTIFKIDEPLTSGYRILISDTIQEYRYWRYYQPVQGTYCNIT